MGWQPKNVNDSLLPLNILYAFLGFTPFQYPIGRHRFIFSVVYAVILSLFFWIAFVLVIQHSISSDWYRREEKVFFFIVCVIFVIATLAQFRSWYHVKRYLGIMNRIAKIDDTLHGLGSTFDYRRCFNIAKTMVIYWLFVICFVGVINMFWLINQVPLIENIIINLVLYLPLHLNTAVDLHFILLINVVRDRFNKVNELLEDLLEPVKKKSSKNYSRGILSNKVNDSATLDVASYRPKLRINNIRKNSFQAIRHVHLELTKISESVNSIYGLQILLALAAFFVELTGSLYVFYILAVSPSTDNANPRMVIVAMGKILNSILLMTINYSCEKTTAEVRRTGDIINCPNYNHDSEEFHDEIRLFSHQLTINPVRFSPVGFFTLGFPFVRGFFGAVVTYVVILIQSGPDLKL